MYSRIHLNQQLQQGFHTHSGLNNASEVLMHSVCKNRLEFNYIYICICPPLLNCCLWETNAKMSWPVSLGSADHEHITYTELTKHLPFASCSPFIIAVFSSYFTSYWQPNHKHIVSCWIKTLLFLRHRKLDARQMGRAKPQLQGFLGFVLFYGEQTVPHKAVCLTLNEKPSLKNTRLHMPH